MKLTEVRGCPSMSASILQAYMIEAEYSITKSKSMVMKILDISVTDASRQGLCCYFSVGYTPK